MVEESRVKILEDSRTTAIGAEQKHVTFVDGLPLTVRDRSLAVRRSDGKVCPKADRHRSARNRQDWGGNADIPVRRNDDAASGLTERLTGTDD